jgi:hypothetical protein
MASAFAADLTIQYTSTIAALTDGTIHCAFMANKAFLGTSATVTYDITVRYTK